jgi:cytidyltransferase-like protein
MYKERYSLFIGRYQPFHDGHRWLIEQRLKEGKNVCIAIMDVHDLEPVKNPFTTDEVYENITTKLSDLIKDGRVTVIIIPPIDSVNVGRTVGYDIIEHVPPEEVKEISATNIRKQLKKEGKL